MIKRIDVPGLKPVGAYSTVVQVSQVGDMFFVSGLLGMNYETGEFPGGFAAQTEKIMENLKKVLRHLDLEFEDVVKATVYVTDMDNFGIFNEVYGRYFDNDEYPAREVVEVRRLPKDALVEVSFILMRTLDDKFENVADKVKDEFKESFEEIRRFFDKLTGKFNE